MLGSSIFMWRTKLFQLTSKVIDKAITNIKVDVIVKDNLETMLDKIKPLIGTIKSEGVSKKGSNIYEQILKEPSQVRTKACEEG